MAEFREGVGSIPMKNQVLIPEKELSIFQQAAFRQTRQKIRISVKAREGGEYYSMQRTEDYPAKPKKVPKGNLLIDITAPAGAHIEGFWMDVNKLRQKQENPKK